MSPDYCMYPDHEGSMVIAHSNDVWLERVEYVRKDRRVRRNVSTRRIVCSKCLRKIEDITDEMQGAML